MLTVIDGPTTLKHLQENPLTAEILVVFMTARAQSRELEHFKSLVVAGAISERFDPMALAGAVREYLDTTTFINGAPLKRIVTLAVTIHKLLP